MAEPHGLTNRGPRIPKLESGEKNNGVGATAQRSNVVRGAVALSLSLLLIQACASGDVAAVANLVSEQNANPFSKDESGRTPLGVACEAGHVQVAKYLIETEGVSPVFRGAGRCHSASFSRQRRPPHCGQISGRRAGSKSFVHGQKRAQTNRLCKE
ncbi:hypothetical protein GBAR_LOCUS11736 [Geodia barretti]|uniref:Ankyrin repeat domain-containing protein n=1 Tax=Geodia barretti TaxID=519541 RepID=A0AA35RXE1_GEOBA|nr:hypothetical protein GBAR_LOCUS11736 [Geodia barretti]